jgi:hypothetical protein
MSGIGSNPTAEEIAAKEAQERGIKAAQVGDLTNKAQAEHHPTSITPTTRYPIPTPTRNSTQVMKMSRMAMIRERRWQRKEERLRRRRRPRSFSRR